ncbi:MAG: DEAD/DEAH box helicase [Actinobacteria bacterium]|nr:DEAD/DEAH box helicase [Actinomycetota bacterium]
MNAADLIEKIMASRHYRGQIAHIETISHRGSVYGELSSPLHPHLQSALRDKGINSLYLHQARAVEKVRRGRHIVVVTPTASGKSLCYNLPVLDRLLQEPRACALYLFPTKSLGRDQLEGLSHFGLPVTAGIYDGDTPDGEKASLRERANIIITNPDMVHRGILPNHLKWHRFFTNLRYIVIDEMHNYRGVFGTHTAHLIRRLRRICSHYGSDPVFILCSATIANPSDHASRLTGLPVSVVDDNGAPRGKVSFVLWKPPQRLSYIKEAAWLLGLCMENRSRTIAFSRSRQVAERILRFARGHLGEKKSGRLMAYRGGYLAAERRKIEKALFSGSLMGVVSTNALELGIDVGNLDVCIIAGFPGTIASTWQQAGRVGRQNSDSVVIFIAVENPLDQYFIRNTRALFARPSEHAMVDPANPYLLMGHALCAAHEIPVTGEDRLLWNDAFGDVLTLLEEDGLLVLSEGIYYYNGQFYPSERVSIRSSSSQNYHLRDTGRNNRLVGILDGSSALSEVYPGAVYMHQGGTFIVRDLDTETATAYMERGETDYYTMCHREKSTEIISVNRHKEINGQRVYTGQVRVTTRVTGYVKKHEITGQVMGGSELNLPEQVMETTGTWIVFEDLAVKEVKRHGYDLMGGLHAMEHASIGLLPLFAMCDRNDLGGLSTISHSQTGRPTVFIHDSCQGGVGFSEKGYDEIKGLLEETLKAISSCRCPDGCPSCIQSPKCSNFNRPLDKECAVLLLRLATGKPYRSPARQSPGPFGTTGENLRRSLKSILGMNEI